MSNRTTESQTGSFTNRHTPNTTASQGKPKTAWGTPPPTMIQAHVTDTGIVSELKSSKSELEALKAQMSEMEADKNAKIQEIEQRAEQQRNQSEASAREQRIQMEQQAEAQRNEFRRQLEEQRKAFEAETLRRQQEMEARLQEQIQQAIQAHLPATSPPSPPQQTPEEVSRRMENQDARIQQLTEMIQQLLPRSPVEPPTQPARSSTGKRHAPHTVVDLVMDHYDLENASQQSEMRRTDQGGKKRDTKETPRQNLAGNISIKMERSDSPAPSELSMSMMDPPASQITENTVWQVGIHPPSEVYSPPAPPRTVRMGMGHTSPLSNLALHPTFRSPSTQEYRGDQTVSTEETFPHQPSTTSFDESNISEAHMRDIHAQHAGLQGFNIHHGNADSPQEKEHKSAKGPQEDEPGAHQATPVGGSPRASHHESER